MAASSQGNLGSTAVLKWNGTAVAELKGTIPHVGINAGKVDFTNRDFAWEESKPGKLSGKTLNISGNFLPGDAAQIAMRADQVAKTVREVVIENTTAGWSITFDAWISDLDGESPDGDNAESFTATLVPSGEIVYAATASAGLTTPFFSISESAVIIPAPAAAVYTYTASVLTAITSVTVTPTATAGVITVQGNIVATGVASSAIALGAAGSVTTITITVKETGKTKKTYTIYLARAAS